MESSVIYEVGCGPHLGLKKIYGLCLKELTSSHLHHPTLTDGVAYISGSVTTHIYGK